MAHSHGSYGHGSHSHGGGGAGNQRRLAWALGITVVFMVVEVIGGVIAGSLALIADAAHMMTDAAALLLALVALQVGQRMPDQSRSFGYRRFEILAAFVNGLALFLIGGWVIFEAVQRLLNPVEVDAWPMFWVAVVGTLANLASFLILIRGEQENLNLRGAVLHVLSDLLGSIGAMAAALVIAFTGWTEADPILSVVVSVLVFRSAWIVVRRSAHILMEGVPEGMEIAEVRDGILEAIPGVKDVHHVHIWALSGEKALITLHVVIDPTTVSHQDALAAIRRHLEDRHGLDHATIQIEHHEPLDAPDGCEPVEKPAAT